jgi:hypothetical protein
MGSFKTPILIIAWNRPNHLCCVISEIRKIAPCNIYVAIDGPRLGDKYENEREFIQQTKDVVQSEIDWNCNLQLNYQDTNLGCRQGVQTAISWFFQNVEEGIIIEDDILPSESFFYYCSEMLELHRNNKSIFSVSGCNLGYKSILNGVGYTRYFNMWGWATWKRSLHLVNLHWGEFEKRWFISDYVSKNLAKNMLLLRKKRWLQHWQSLMYKTRCGIIDTWDYQWLYACLSSDSKCIYPYQNQIKNIGWDGSGTHTVGDSLVANLSYGKKYSSNRVLNLVKFVNPFYEYFYVAKRWSYYGVLFENYWGLKRKNVSYKLNKLLRLIFNTSNT